MNGSHTKVAGRFFLQAALVLGAAAGAGCAMETVAPHETSSEDLSATSICDATQLASALASATSGSTVQLGECTVTGSFTVPAGVTLAGRGVARTTLVVTGDTVGVSLTAGAAPSVLRSVTVRTDGSFGVLVTGSGAAAVRNVRVSATRGVGIGAEDVRSVELTSVRLMGPVTPESAGIINPNALPVQTATHGLVLLRVATAAFTAVQVDGFAAFGALIIDSATTWNDGGASGNVGTGAMVWGGSATLRDLALTGTFRGLGDHPSDLVLASGARTSTHDVRVTESEGFGLLQDGAGPTTHRNLVATWNDAGGVWAQKGGARLTLLGPGTALDDNAHAGLVAIDVGLVSVNDAHANRTLLAALEGIAEAGDAIQLVRTAGSLSSVSLADNQRAGFFAELGDALSASHYSFTGVTVSGGEGALGLALQKNGTPLTLVTAGVTRLGAVAATDAAFAEGLNGLPVAGIINPNALPRAQRVATGGLAALFEQEPY